MVEMTGYQAMRLAKLSGKRVEEMFERPKWVGGTESDMFNKLEDIAGMIFNLFISLARLKFLRFLYIKPKQCPLVASYKKSDVPKIFRVFTDIQYCLVIFHVSFCHF